MYSEEQELAIKTTSHDTLIAAAAGSGKTTTIVGRISHLIKQGVEPDTIYAITFTNMAAQEMLERIDYPIFIGTIHSLANKILQTNGVDTSRTIQDESFDELLEMTKRRHMEMPKITHLLVDELQDIADVEFDFIVNTLRAQNLYLVGDSCQSIYGFKGGNFHHFLNFLEEPTTTVYELTTNYRNPRKILAFANTFLKGMGDVYRVESHTYRKEDGEVYQEPYSIKRIVSLIQEDENYKDWFVLARKNSEVHMVMDALERAKIPCGTFKKADKTFEEMKQEMQENKVKVLTIHSAKGLEADNVIVIGAKKFNSEEKRVCYVAATRARERLYWMAENPAKQEYRGNRSKMNPINDYIGEVIEFGRITKDSYIEGAFDSMMSATDRKYSEFMTDEEMENSERLLPTIEDITQDVANLAYQRGFYGGF